MTTRMVLTIMVGMLACLFLPAMVSAQVPMGTAFTYQGFLLKNKNPANDVYDFELELYDASSNGNQVAGPLAVNDVNVEDGHFTVELDFGAEVFDGNGLWLQTGVRPGDSTDPCDFTTLSPRKELTPTPYAIYAAKAAGIAPGGGVGMEDAMVRGFELTYNSPDDLYVEPGTLFHSYTPINKTSRTNLLLAMPTHWWDNQLHSYSAGEGWCYIGVNSSGDIRFLADNPPNAADTAGNTEGTKLYWYDGSNYWRVIGAIRVNTVEQVARRWFQQGNTIMWDVPINVTTTVSNGGAGGAWSGPTSCAAAIPAIASIGIFGLEQGATNDNYSNIWIRPNGSTWAINEANGICGRATAASEFLIAGQRHCMTDPSQQINYYNMNVSGPTTRIDVEGFIMNIR